VKKTTAFACLLLVGFSYCYSAVPTNDRGKPYRDTIFAHTRDSVGVIPGRIEAEWYDLGGEGISLHDWEPEDVCNDLTNNPQRNDGVELKKIYWDWRMLERGKDSTFREPDSGHVYIGWTHTGEWLCYTVRVDTAGTYLMTTHMSVQNDSVKYMYIIDEKDTIGPVYFPNTGGPHIWWVFRDFVEINLTAGMHVLKRLNYCTNDNFMGNFDYLDFKLKTRSAETAIAVNDNRPGRAASRGPTASLVPFRAHTSLFNILLLNGAYGGDGSPGMHSAGVFLEIPPEPQGH
jgi:hypothetical protein